AAADSTHGKHVVQSQHLGSHHLCGRSADVSLHCAAGQLPACQAGCQSKSDRGTERKVKEWSVVSSRYYPVKNLIRAVSYEIQLSLGCAPSSETACRVA